MAQNHNFFSQESKSFFLDSFCSSIPDTSRNLSTNSLIAKILQLEAVLSKANLENQELRKNKINLEQQYAQTKIKIYENIHSSLRNSNVGKKAHSRQLSQPEQELSEEIMREKKSQATICSRTNIEGINSQQKQDKSMRQERPNSNFPISEKETKYQTAVATPQLCSLQRKKLQFLKKRTHSKQKETSNFRSVEQIWNQASILVEKGKKSRYLAY